MKTLILMLSLMSAQAFAQAETCSSFKTFEGTSVARLGDNCDMFAAETHALNKCRRAGYFSCRRLPGISGAEILDGGSGQVCIAKVRGNKICD